MLYNNGVGHVDFGERHTTTMADFGTTGFAHRDNVRGESQMFSVHRCTDSDDPAVLKFPDASVRPEQNPFPKGDHCALYDPTAPSGYKFKMFNKRGGGPKVEQKRPEDIAKKLNELKSYSDSPVYLVHELMLFQNKKIDYDLISVKGQVHCPEFVFHAKCDDIIVYGSGASKKEAKKNAAIAFLNQYLRNINPNNDITSTTSNNLESVSSTSLNTSQSLIIDREKMSVLEARSETNPVGVLQELCMARRWQLPEYQCSKAENAFYTNYIVECCLQTHTTRGEGKTKQVAKRQAARLMYNKIIGLSQEVDMTSSFEENQDTCDYQIPSMALLNNNKSLQENSKLMKKLNVSDTLKCMDLFFNQLKSSTKPHINNLRSFNCISEFNASSVDVLNKIGDEEGFNITYVKIAKKSEKSEVLVQVSIIPLLVNIGTGNTMEEAQELAAYSALSYLKMLLDN